MCYLGATHGPDERIIKSLGAMKDGLSPQAGSPLSAKANAALVGLRRIIRATDAAAKDLARATELTTSQLLVLNILENGGPHTIGELVREVNLAQATVTTLVDRLEERGLVSRSRGEIDRRKVQVALLPSAAEVLRRAPTLLQTIFLRNFAQLSDWEQSLIVASLERVAHMLNAESLDASPVLDVGAVDRTVPSSRK